MSLNPAITCLYKRDRDIQFTIRHTTRYVHQKLCIYTRNTRYVVHRIKRETISRLNKSSTTFYGRISLRGRAPPVPLLRRAATDRRRIQFPPTVPQLDANASVPQLKWPFHEPLLGRRHSWTRVFTSSKAGCKSTTQRGIAGINSLDGIFMQMSLNKVQGGVLHIHLRL